MRKKTRQTTKTAAAAAARATEEIKKEKPRRIRAFVRRLSCSFLCSRLSIDAVHSLGGTELEMLGGEASRERPIDFTPTSKKQA